MATSKIKIYRTHILPERNALVDGIETYLGSLTPTYENDNFQYLQLGMDLTIKLNVSQDTIANQSLGNYARIEQSNKVWYYFIMNSDWKGVSTVSLDLSIDSINTFRDDFTMSARTSIKRQHGNRFYRTVGGNNLVRRIDPESEGLNTEKEKVSENKILQNNKNIDWYLMYRTRKDLSSTDIANPVSCYCFASEPLTIQRESGSATTFAVSDFIQGDYYYFSELDNPGGEMVFAGTTFKLGTLIDVPINPGSELSGPTYGKRGLLKMIELNRYNEKLIRASFYAVGDNNQPFVYDTLTGVGEQNFIASSLATASTSQSITVKVGNFFRFSNVRWFFSGPYGVSANITARYNIDAGQAQRVVSSFADIDRTDARIIKIIKLPYAPTNVTYNASTDTYTFSDDWEYDSGLMKLKDSSLALELESQIGITSLSELFLDVPAANRAVTVNKDISRESKLFHSDFYTKKLVYDSFSHPIMLEQIDLSGHVFNNPTPTLSYIPIYFKPTNTVNSKFAFKIDYDAIADNFGTYKALADYDNYLLTTRNNEETIYSNDFVNYIRNGYNYDKKQLAKQQVSQAIGTVASVAGTVISAIGTGGLGKVGVSTAALLASGADLRAASKKQVAKQFTEEAKKYNLPSAGTKIAAGINIAANIAQTIVSNVSNKEQLQQKLNELSVQSTTVSGSDDINLLSYYNGNKLTIFTYDTKTYNKDALFDLMYYTGYAYNHNDIPNTTSRYWFNFVQCSPVFNEEGTSPYNDYLDDIKQRFEAGVTVYHRHNNIGFTYDWNQELENWETFIGIAPTPNIIVRPSDINYIISFDAVDPLGEWDDDGITTFYQFEITNNEDQVTYVNTRHANQRSITVPHTNAGIKKIRIRENNTTLGKTTEWYKQDFSIS